MHSHDDEFDVDPHDFYEEEGPVAAYDDVDLGVLNDVVNVIRWLRDASSRYGWTEQEPPQGLIEDLRDAERSLVSAMVSLTASVASQEASDV